MWAKIRWDRAFARPANATPAYNPSKTAPNGLQTGRITPYGVRRRSAVATALLDE